MEMSLLELSKHKILGGIEWLHHLVRQETEGIAQESQGKRCDRISKVFTALHDNQDAEHYATLVFTSASSLKVRICHKREFVLPAQSRRPRATAIIVAQFSFSL